MYRYTIDGEDFVKGKVRKVGRGYALSLTEEWKGEEVIVVREGKIKKMEEKEIEGGRKGRQ